MPLPHEREPLERRLPYLKPDVMDFLKVHLAYSRPDICLVLTYTPMLWLFVLFQICILLLQKAKGRGRFILSCHHHLH